MCLGRLQTSPTRQHPRRRPSKIRRSRHLALPELLGPLLTAPPHRVRIDEHYQASYSLHNNILESEPCQHLRSRPKSRRFGNLCLLTLRKHEYQKCWYSRVAGSLICCRWASMACQRRLCGDVDVSGLPCWARGGPSG